MTNAREPAPCALPLRGSFVMALRLLLFIGVCILPAMTRAQRTVDPPSRVFVDGEELVYNVRYGFIDLGQVKIKLTSPARTNANAGYDATGFIDSYRNPFVDLHAVYKSLIDTGVFSHKFTGKMKHDGIWNVSRYDFDYARKRVLIEVDDNDTVLVRRDTLSIDTVYHDGLSLFFLARDRLYCGKRLVVPTMIKEQKVTTTIDFRTEHASVDLDAVDYPVDVIRFDGNMDFVGIFGLTGGFEGWFSNDEARVPILAKMKVLIGSVTVELMKWSRPGWAPPRAKG